VAERDAITELLGRATALARGRPGDEDVDALLAALGALGDRDVVRFDKRSRSYGSGLDRAEIAALRSPWRRGAARRLWAVLGLVSADGFHRQWAIAAADLQPGVVALVAVRCTDWVAEVRETALLRLAEAPAAVLLERLALLEALAVERPYGGGLDALVEARLGDDDLRAATRSDRAPVRRAAWRRLVARGACAPGELIARAARDRDIRVRAVAASALPALGERDRRRLAETLLGDRIGWLAGRGLDALVALDGAPVIPAALIAPSASLRRRARGWAAVRGLDARAVYLARLRHDPADALALVALAEIGHAADDAVVVGALEDPRSAVRVAALKAVARRDPAAAKAAALAELDGGREGRVVGRAAALVLRAAALRDDDLARLEAIALDAGRPAGARLRALALLRPARWRHLAAALQARAVAEEPLRGVLDDELRTWIADSSRVARGPDAPRREAIEALLPGLDETPRRSIAFVLRTAR
jgi:hypothetical protein